MRRPTTITLAPLVLAAALASCARGEGAPAARADFTFGGTVLLPHAATIDLDDASDFAIVRVDGILAGSEAFRATLGKAISVRLRQPDRAREGERRVYFTKAWHWGEDIGVIELSSVAAPTGPEMQAMQSDIERQRQEQSDRELAERLRTAELVVIGRVTAVRRSDLPHIVSEHDPDWQEAEIEVASVVRGNAPGGQVTILFPGTDDPMWYASPRFAKGDEGIWLLHPLTLIGKRLPRLTALQRGDFRPRSDEARVRRLLPK